MATGMVSSPFPMGLDSSGDSPVSDTQAMAGSASAVQPPQAAPIGDSKVASSAPSGTERQTILDEVRRTVLEDVDVKLADKMKDLWSRGNKMLKQIERENEQQTAKLLEELAARREKQEALKAEQEHLRTLLTSMVQQFSVLGAAYGSLPTIPTPGTPKATHACDASTSSSADDSTTAGPSLQDSPPGLGPPAFGNGSFAPLPTMPDFPYPAADASPMNAAATPLSLVDALGSENPAAPVPVSLLGSLPATPSSESDYGRVFSFTLRKADGTDLGINVSHHEHDKMLRVEGVRPEGAVEAWNRQCIGSASAEKAVIPGDRIISVNAVTDEPARMLEECRDKQLLKFTILRGGPTFLPTPMVPSPVTLPTPKSTTLRADACEFTPTLRADACEFIPGGLITEQAEQAGVSLESSIPEAAA